MVDFLRLARKMYIFLKCLWGTSEYQRQVRPYNFIYDRLYIFSRMWGWSRRSGFGKQFCKL